MTATMIFPPGPGNPGPGPALRGPGELAEPSVTVTDEELVIRLPRPAGAAGRAAEGRHFEDSAGAENAAGGKGPGRDDAAMMLFAARADSFHGLVLWHRYRAIYDLASDRIAEANAAADANTDTAGNGSGDVFTRLYDPLCQVAASYAVVAGVRQCTAERFVDEALACFDRIPAIGRLLRDGVLTPFWFRRAIEQTALIDDPDILAFIDTEAAHRLTTIGGLTARRVENTIAHIVATHDPDAVTTTREDTRAQKKVLVAPVTDTVSELIITTSTEDAVLCKDTIDAVIAGVCRHDPRTKGERRADAAVARLTGTPFVCACERADCAAELSDHDVAARCASIVLHVVVRKETLDGSSDTPAVLDGHGPISAAHVRELAQRPDATTRDLDLGRLLDRTAQRGNPYRPTAVLDTAVRGLFGTCSWVGCDRPAWRCDLDHVTEYNHADPGSGGPTCACNLNPKCRFHHGLKTHTRGWLDDQIIDAHGIVWTELTTPEGITVRRQAANIWLLPELGLLPCDHNTPTTSDPDSAPNGDPAGNPTSATRRTTRHAENAPKRTRTRLEAKHRYRMQQRAINRRHRETEEAEQTRAARAAGGDGRPPF
ncbi:DUF222 domain-containing protein [Gordonia shandongensis]|uniref:DUF222 domain-containing protein n=1 Tax=Gordonia shandongensis TaxID=376351 RepID=UPI000421E8CF|nr:DUF222 domain-containing protein [Gordonia shandongensis]